MEIEDDEATEFNQSLFKSSSIKPIEDALLLDFDDSDDDYMFNITKATKVILYYGNSQSDSEWMNQNVNNTHVNVRPYSSGQILKESYKYMPRKIFETTDSLNDYLNDVIDEINSIYKQRTEANHVTENDTVMNILHDLFDDEAFIKQLTLKTSVETYYLGRIRYGYDSKSGSNNRNIIQLESNTRYSNGEVVPLDLSLYNKNKNDDEHHMSLFPGQIVIVKGDNPNGKFIRVTEFMELDRIFSPKFIPKCPSILSGYESINIVCARGPFVSYKNKNSTEINMTDTTYMKALANYVKQYNPHILLIFGPIYDEAQSEQLMQWSLQENKTVDDTFPCQWTTDRLFNFQMGTLSKELEGRTVNTQIIFIPSANELGSELNIFPTAPVEIKQNYPIQSYSNPAILDMGGIIVGTIATDILLHMSRYEISNISNENVGKGDRLKRLCSHMLKHKCFYPLLPIDVNLNLELSQFDHLNMPITPHLMFTPSVLRPFIYNVNDTIVVNPGLVTKNTIARIKIEPMKSRSEYTGSIVSCINGEIIKLLS
ncbi:hypothetical protein RDWZM_009608 [Blomia tropicalis]|uniref:DNA polymerase alpha subunit B n=1 Tax=Blomia tropicalis TaxID=40697 RepID=A0A9Q0RL84_BLOTA|nr:bifunctional diacylglycerol diphosphate phosphatase/phosphatidate phosphatase [Blomia tropicalis]KAJ6218451.1 hypothetical protein RDWZM_009608 [Blomia tropicalis]